MNLLTIDFETYFDNTTNLKKMTTEEYIHAVGREGVHGIGVKEGEGKAVWIPNHGSKIMDYLRGIDWSNTTLIAHNSHFDAALIMWFWDVSPARIADTLAMSRFTDGAFVSHKLDDVAVRYGLGSKAEGLAEVEGIRTSQIPATAFQALASYCKRDVELCYAIYKKLVDKVPEQELEVIDITCRMFSEPSLQLDREKLDTHLTKLENLQEELIDLSGTDIQTLRSNPKFATHLEGLGVDPPKKVSTRTQKETYAFSKQDLDFVDLLNHTDDEVVSAVRARIATKSTIEASRCERLLEIAERNKSLWPVPIRCFGAHTGRWVGFDKCNPQNMPSRTKDLGLKDSIRAPEGHVLIDVDSSQIEARILAWISGEHGLTEKFRNGDDVYVSMASRIFNKPEDQIEKQERAIGKSTILGSGYGMGRVRFEQELKKAGVTVSNYSRMAKDCIDTYRRSYPGIPKFWYQCNDALRWMYYGNMKAPVSLGKVKDVATVTRDGTIALPNSYQLRYPKLNRDLKNNFTYEGKRGPSHIWGGVVCENIVQGLARNIIAEQLVSIAQRYTVALSVHDSVVLVVPENKIKEAEKFVTNEMSRTPSWAEGLPLACEAITGETYAFQQ
jgi:DNA polymerase I-like protein with 3'-5' exonuclease and polymerase domains